MGNISVYSHAASVTNNTRARVYAIRSPKVLKDDIFVSCARKIRTLFTHNNMLCAQAGNILSCAHKIKKIIIFRGVWVTNPNTGLRLRILQFLSLFPVDFCMLSCVIKLYGSWRVNSETWSLGLMSLRMASLSFIDTLVFCCLLCQKKKAWSCL